MHARGEAGESEQCGQTQPHLESERASHAGRVQFRDEPSLGQLSKREERQPGNREHDDRADGRPAGAGRIGCQRQRDDAGGVGDRHLSDQRQYFVAAGEARRLESLPADRPGLA